MTEQFERLERLETALIAAYHEAQNQATADNLLEQIAAVQTAMLALQTTPAQEQHHE